MTDTTKFNIVVSTEIWVAKDRKTWIVWVENGEYPCKTLDDVMKRIRDEVTTRVGGKVRIDYCRHS